MSKLASRSEDEVRHALEVLAGADRSVIAHQLEGMHLLSGAFGFTFAGTEFIISAPIAAPVL